MPLDTLVTGRIATLAGSSGFGWVEAVGIRDGRVAFAGSAVDLETRADPFTRRIELEPDQVAIPGLTDAHIHLADTALGFDRIDLAKASTLAEGLDLIAAADRALPDGDWLQGQGWDSDRWGGWPTRADLDRTAPGRRVALWKHDHHAIWASSPAFEAAGIDDSTADPPGGIVRRDGGVATGVLLESAVTLIISVIPVASVDDYHDALIRMAPRLLELGVVGAQDPCTLLSGPELGPGLEAYRRLAASGRLPLRIHASLRDLQLDAALAAGLRSGQSLGNDDSRIRFGWLKLFADGTLGSRTAALLEPIVAQQGHPVPAGTERGVFVTPPERLAELAERAAAGGIAAQIHAIGDAAARAALGALEPTVGRVALMPRVEHCQLIQPEDRPRFGQAGIAASVQPVHLRADAAAARITWGSRAETAGYAWRSLAAAGALLAFGTDAPVEPIDPWPGLAMAVARADASWPAGTPPFGPQEALTLDAALRAASIGPPATAREEDRGRLTPGQHADLIVLPAAVVDDPVVAGGELATARPQLVMLGGQTVFEA